MQGQMGLFDSSVRLIGRCAVCGRSLTDPTSVAAGVGPTCAIKRNAADTKQQDQERPYDEVRYSPSLKNVSEA